MINEAGGAKPEDDEDLDEYEDEEFTDTTVLSDSEGTDNVGDASVEINVEQLIADFEKSDEQLSARRKEVRRRLEELAELKALEDTFAFDFDDD